MFLSDPGSLVGGRTEKERPCAWPTSWYGSCARGWVRLEATRGAGLPVLSRQP